MGILQVFREPLGSALVIRAIGYGLVLAAVIGFFVCITDKKIVRSILSSRALSRDGAKTAEELSLGSPVFRFALRDGSAIRKTVKKVPDDEPPRYYIPEDGSAAAELRYVKKTSPVTWVIGAALLVAATEASVRLVPWILGLF